eukprot:scaffold20382_cov129-Isochrysis_galbana.AAC.1
MQAYIGIHTRQTEGTGTEEGVSSFCLSRTGDVVTSAACRRLSPWILLHNYRLPPCGGATSQQEHSDLAHVDHLAFLALGPAEELCGDLVVNEADTAEAHGRLHPGAEEEHDQSHILECRDLGYEGDKE